MRSAAILRVAVLAVVGLFVAGAVPALSSTSSMARRGGVALRRVWMKPGATVVHRVLPPLPVRVADPAAYRREKAQSEAGYRRWLRAHAPAAAAALRHAVRPIGVSGGLNHAGLAASDETKPGTPPDTTGAAGPSNYVEMVNSTVAVYSKTDLSAPTQTMDEGSFVGITGSEACDGNVQWDQEGGRWLYSALGPCVDHAPSYALYFGWSKTSSPSLDASNWCQFAIDTHTALDDYPKLGHDDTQILIGANEFASDGIFPTVYVLDKPANGDESCPDVTTEESTAKELNLIASPPGIPWTPVPANIADSSAVGYVAAIDRDQKHFHLYVIGRDSGNANALLSAQRIRVPAFCIPPNVPQKGSRHMIDSLDSRLTQAVAVTDPTTGREGIWTQHTVASSCKNGHAIGPSVVRWYELARGQGIPLQTGTVRGAHGAFAFMGAISPSADGQNAAIFYNSSSSTTFPDFRVRDRHLETTPGTMPEDLQLATSTSPDKDRSCLYGLPFPCRWGDYNGASPDPSDPSLIWGTGELTVVPPHTVTHAPQWGSDNAAIDVSPAATYGLDVEVVDTRAGTGTVSSSPDGIASCTSSCSYDYAYGTPVQLTATPGVHSIFHWSGDCSGNGVCTLPMGGPENVTATFVPQPESLSYVKSGAGSGRVTFLPRGRRCASSCSVVFDYGTRVVVRATAARGSAFRGWSGACRGRRRCRVTMRDAERVRARFVKLRR